MSKTPPSEIMAIYFIWLQHTRYTLIIVTWGKVFLGKVFDTGAIVNFVYALAPTVGLTLTNAPNGLTGTRTAAALSLFMYLAFPDGCSNAEAYAPCCLYGVLEGASSVTCCLLLDLGKSSPVFYCANFVWFWMAFLDPSQPKRTTIEMEDKIVLNWLGGFAFTEWGGGVFVCASP